MLYSKLKRLEKDIDSCRYRLLLYSNCLFQMLLKPEFHVDIAGFAHNEFRTYRFAQNEVYCVARFFLLMD